MNKLNEWTTTLAVKASNVLSNEKGAQSLEWLGLAALLIMVLGFVSTALSGGQSQIQDLVNKIFTSISEQFGG
ncbi:hypothetical protein ACE3MZ_01830 [Paenibacillus sp. WLX1005]|uniref:hypothetical protein n=1 Tax=Paenibacillus sp. WLX1005 TaxID=3243766 RepID=UPI003983F7C8